MGGGLPLPYSLFHTNLVLGCDGVFDVLMNNELAILIKSLFAEKEDLSVTTEGKEIYIPDSIQANDNQNGLFSKNDRYF